MCSTRRSPPISTEEVIEHFRGILPELGERLERATRHPSGLETPKQLTRLGLEVETGQIFHLGLLFRDKVSETVNDVLDDSPAGASGIAPDDVLTTVNGFAFSPQALQWAATHSAPVRLGVLRGHLPRSAEARLGKSIAKAGRGADSLCYSAIALSDRRALRGLSRAPSPQSTRQPVARNPLNI